MVAALLLVLAACRNGGGTTGDDLLVVVSVPLTKSPWVGEMIVNGATLAADEINAAGGIEVGDRKRPVRLQVLDHGDSAQAAQSHARRAVEDGAVLLISDGVGAIGVAETTEAGPLPAVITYESGTAVVDEDERPTLFRLAPANRPMTRRLADYLAEKEPRVALITDATSYGKDGERELREAFTRNRTPVTAVLTVPTGAADASTQVLTARNSGADTVVVWARAPVVASVVRAMRASGWTAPVYTGPTGEDPIVRQQLADHPEWVDGLTFVSFRITAEVGPEPWERFRAAYEERFGAERIGVGDVVQPPDWAMYPYDALHLLKAALERADATGQPLIDAFNTVSITGANGDERSFGPQNHEGVSPDDMYFGRFRAMRFQPVGDDLLSTNLPPVRQ